VVIPDVNLLIYAANKHSAHHERAWTWMNELFGSSRQIGLPAMVLWGYIRIGTSEAVLREPLATAEALGHIRHWFSQNGVVRAEPGLHHWEILGTLLSSSRLTGSRTSDAVLAAIAIEHGATLASTDQDFKRFDGLNWVDPLGD
jgi:toxin-antitoxin system PIN domain toxin